MYCIENKCDFLNVGFTALRYMHWSNDYINKFKLQTTVLGVSLIT